MEITKITDKYAVCSQPQTSDIEDIAAAGYAAVICNRPDDEDPDQPRARAVAAACEEAGIGFHHIPVSGTPLADAAVQEQSRIVESSPGPVLAYCRTGQRSKMLWQPSS